MRIARVVVVFLILFIANVVFALEETYSDYYLKGRAQAIEGNLLGAEENIEKAISLNPKFAPSYVCMSGIYLKNANFEKSIQSASKAISLDPKLADAYKNRAVAHIKQQNFDLAKEDILKYQNLSKEPTHLRALYKYSKGEYLDAINEAAITLKQNPKEPFSATIRLASYAELKNYPRALEVAKEMAKQNPALENNEDFLYYRALSYSATNKPKNALKDANKLVALDSKNVDYFVLRAMLHAYSLNKKASHKDFEAARNICQEEGSQEAYIKLVEYEKDLNAQVKHAQAQRNSGALFAAGLLNIVSGILSIVALSL